MDRFVVVPGGRLFVRDEGEGEAVVLIHAAVADQRAWDSTVPRLVEDGFRTIRYDLRAFGRSTTEAIEFDPIADLAAVLEACDVSRAAIVGNSWGGTIALDAAIAIPARVVAVVAIGSGLGGYEPPVRPDELAFFEAGDRLVAQEPRDPDAVADLLVRLWVDGIGQPADRVPAPIREQIRGVCREQYDPSHVQGKAVALKPPANERLSELRCPVLAVAGGLDVSDTVTTARYLEESAPNARAVVMPGVAHMAAMEKPDEVAALIAEFLAPLRPW